MIILGLTGSIGMGKTTTAYMFKELGCPVFDADAAVHQLYSRGGKGVKLIRAVFPDAIHQDGSVNRKTLGQYMRADPLNLRVLESFVHPWVGELRATFFEKAKKDKYEIVVLDVPLLFETGGDKRVDYSIVVTAPYEVQKERVMSREGMSKALFERLLSRQMPDTEKRQRADFIISTATSLSDTRKQVQCLLEELKSL